MLRGIEPHPELPPGAHPICSLSKRRLQVPSVSPGTTTFTQQRETCGVVKVNLSGH